MGKKCTTAGIFSTLGVLGTGIGLTLHYASSVASQCASAVSALPTLTSTMVTIPSMALNTIVHIPDMDRNISLIVDTPRLSIALATLLGLSENVNQTLQQAPGIVGDVCRYTILEHGLTLTLLAASLAGLVTMQITAYRSANAHYHELKEAISLTQENTGRSFSV